MKTIYFDNNATTAVAPEVREAILPYLGEFYGNPSSMHTFGGQVADAVENARETMANLLGANPDEIIFTSCGSESDNAAIWSAIQTQPEKRHLITTRVEHPAILSVMQHWERQGYRVTLLGVDNKGRLDLDEYAAWLRTRASAQGSKPLRSEPAPAPKAMPARCSAAVRTSPASSAARTPVEQLISSSTEASDIGRTSKCPFPSSASVDTSPEARLPNRKFSPTTTRTGRSGSRKRSTKAAGDMAATSLVKRMTRTSLAPAALSSSIRVRRSVSSFGALSGRRTETGWGQNVTTTSGNSRPRVASRRTLRCPTWTPSKLPIATTVLVI